MVSFTTFLRIVAWRASPSRRSSKKTYSRLISRWWKTTSGPSTPPEWNFTTNFTYKLQSKRWSTSNCLTLAKCAASWPSTRLLKKETVRTRQTRPNNRICRTWQVVRTCQTTPRSSAMFGLATSTRACPTKTCTGSFLSLERSRVPKLHLTTTRKARGTAMSGSPPKKEHRTHWMLSKKSKTFRLCAACTRLASWGTCQALCSAKACFT